MLPLFLLQLNAGKNNTNLKKKGGELNLGLTALLIKEDNTERKEG